MALSKKMWLVVVQGPRGRRVPFGFPTKKGQLGFIHDIKRRFPSAQYIFSMEKVTV